MSGLWGWMSGFACGGSFYQMLVFHAANTPPSFGQIAVGFAMSAIFAAVAIAVAVLSPR